MTDQADSTNQEATPEPGGSAAAICYEGDFGNIFHFNEPVIAEFCPVPESERIGRLVQVRKKAGSWGSDIYFIRRVDGSLMTFENVGLRKYKGKVAEPDEADSVGAEYSVRGEYLETGFVVDEPCGPPAQDQSFSMIIASS